VAQTVNRGPGVGPTEDLRQEIADLSLQCDALEHLLYPQKRGPDGTVIWENSADSGEKWRRRESNPRKIPAGGLSAVIRSTGGSA
jgi:hypothetical protein